jgi:hypothetical protein
MEKQEFLMEVCELSQGKNNILKDATVALVKEAIRNAAKLGFKQIQTYARFNVNLDTQGYNMILPIADCLDYFRDQGFNIVVNGNYITFSWE